MTHIYDWLDHPELLTTDAERKLWEFLDRKTRPAFESLELTPKYLGLRVYRKYEGIEYRITGASRLGDVWLKNISPELELEPNPSRYNKRVSIDDCSDFRYIDERKVTQ